MSSNPSWFNEHHRNASDPPRDPNARELLVRLTGTGPVWSSAESGFAIWNMRDERSGDMGKLTGHLINRVAGEILNITGAWKKHPKHGWSFAVENASSALPVSRDGIVKWMSETLPNVGETFASAIVDHFESEQGVEKVIEVIDEDPARLGDVKTSTGRSMKDERLEMLIEAWADSKQQRQLELFFRTHKITAKLGHRLFEKYGDELLDVLNNDPYQITEIRGIGFRMADVIAQNLGVETKDPRRIKAGLLYVMQEAENDGHTYMLLPELYSSVAMHLFSMQKGDFLTPADQKLVGDQATQLIAERKLVVETAPDNRQRVYRRFIWKLECQLAERIRWMSQAGKVHQLCALPPRPLEGDYIPTDEQWDALTMAYTHRLSVLTGGPGTGKTRVTNEIIEGAKNARLHVEAAAPTGKAARRMAEVSKHPAQTIHRLLKWSPQDGGFQHNADDPIHADLLIVDESSMLSLDLANALFQAIGEHTHVLLVGDIDQLPPIGAGKVLDDIIKCGVVPSTRLTTIFRQAQSSMIIVNAHRMNQGQPPFLKHAQAEAATGQEMDRDFFWLSRDNSREIAETCVHTATVKIPNISAVDKHGKQIRLDPFKDIMILVPMNKGQAGLIELNRMMQEKLNPDGVSIGVKGFRIGDRILQTVNDYTHEIMNGELGIVVSENKEKGEVTLSLDDGERQKDVPKANLDSFILGYAMTIHKSQGSQFKAVVIPVSYDYYTMLNRSLYYTAITRAEMLVVAIGERRALATALKNEASRKRNSALAERIVAAQASGALF